VSTPEVWTSGDVPPGPRTMKLVVRPKAWKARMWRAFDGTVQPLFRFDAEVDIRSIEDRALGGMLMPFLQALRNTHIYCERGAAVALPMAWSVGRLTVEREAVTGFLHHVLEDSFGAVLTGLFGAGDSRADLTLSLVPYEIGRERLVFALRDYDIGTGNDFR